MALAQAHRENFDTLLEAAAHGDVALMECEVAATGEIVAVICAANRGPNGDIEFVPFATLFNDDPYRLVNPPNPDGGFFSQDDVRPD